MGVNNFEHSEDKPVDILKINPEIEKTQRNRLTDLRKNRNNDKVNKDLSDLEAAARAGENIMPYIVEAVRDYATIGEMIKS